MSLLLLLQKNKEKIMPTRITPNQYFGTLDNDINKDWVTLGIIGIVVIGLVLGSIALVIVSKERR